MDNTMESGTYAIAWRPSYFTPYLVAGNREFKNLYTTFTISEAPQINYGTSAGGTIQNYVMYKAELFDMNKVLVGDGQTDGDELIFSMYPGCYINTIGVSEDSKPREFFRKNGKYPQVWVGDTSGVKHLVNTPNQNRLYICWRSASRVPEPTALREDMFKSLTLTNSDPNTGSSTAILYISRINENNQSSEIIDLHPPPENPILYKDELIQFGISDCGSKIWRPTKFGSIDGRVEVTWVKKYLDSTSTIQEHEEIVWFEDFPNDATSASGMSEGNLQGTNCHWNLMNFDQAKLYAGATYRLIIYPRSFRCVASGCTEYLFGELNRNRDPTFKYEFRYEDFSVSESAPIIYPDQKTISFGGINMQEIVLEGHPNSGVTPGTYSSTVKSFGAKLALSITASTCKVAPKAGYIMQDFDTSFSSVEIKNLDLGGCEKGSLNAELKLYRIESAGGLPIAFYTGSTKGSTRIASIECHEPCKTCKGTKETDCLTCQIDSDYPYLYEGECLKECKADQPYILREYEYSPAFPSQLKCVTDCPLGHFNGPEPHKYCLECKGECRTCTSDDIMSCVHCKETITDDSSKALITPEPIDIKRYKFYTEKYLLNNMCMDNCPFLGTLVKASEDHHCHNIYTSEAAESENEAESLTPQLPTVKIQNPGYMQKVSMKKQIRLRALISDPSNIMEDIIWEAFPLDFPEADGDTSEAKRKDFSETKTERAFLNYTEATLQQTIVSLNMNGFNMKGGNALRVIFKLTTNEGRTAYDITELYGNRPPELPDVLDLDTKYLFNQSIHSMEKFNVTVVGCDDPDDEDALVKVKVLMKVKYLEGGGDPLGTAGRRYLSEILATRLPQQVKTLYAAKIPTLTSNVFNVELKMPPLLYGPQRKKNGEYGNIVQGELIVIAQDRHLGISSIKKDIWVKESFLPTHKTLVLQELHSLKLDNMDECLYAAHTLDVINIYSNSMPNGERVCNLDNQCGHGYCHHRAGIQQCVCKPGFTGLHCQWQAAHIIYVHSITDRILTFMKGIYLDSGVLLEDPQIEEIASVVKGILKNPEAVEYSWVEVVFELTKRCLLIDEMQGLRMEEDTKNQVLDSLSTVFEYIVYHEKAYRVSQSKAAPSGSPEEIRVVEDSHLELVSKYIGELMSGLYNFLRQISHAQFPDISAYYKTTRMFDALITSEFDDPMFLNVDADQQLVLKIPGTEGYIKIPRTTFASSQGLIGGKLELKVRLVRWNHNPYIFSNATGLLETDIYNLAILDSFGDEMKIKTSESQPMVYLLPRTQYKKIRNDLGTPICKGLVPTKYDVLRSKPGMLENEYQLDNITIPKFTVSNNIGTIPTDTEQAMYIYCTSSETGEIAGLYMERYNYVQNSARNFQGLYLDFFAMKVYIYIYINIYSFGENPSDLHSV